MSEEKHRAFSSTGLTVLLLLASVTILSACAMDAATIAKGDRGKPVILAVTWKADDTCKVDDIVPDANLCEESHPEFCMPRSKWVQWQSMPPKKYRVYFSPFNTGSFNAGNGGKAKGKIDDNAPYALYKYSIVADGCDPDTQANDPHIRVDK
jgi:hypothetical protein